MRFFLALEIPEECKAELEGIQKNLKEILSPPDIRLLDRGKLHLTLAFVGEQPETLKEDLTQVLIEAAKGESPFSITPAYLDGFPHLHMAHVLWVGVKGDIGQLMVIRHKIKDGLINLHLDVDERRFIPHIALAKANNLKITKQQEEQIEKLIDWEEFAPIRISSLKLFESIPNKGFHEHNTLAEVSLRP